MFFSRDIKKKLWKKALKMTSQLVIFRGFFSVPPTLNLKKNSCKSTHKRNSCLNPFPTIMAPFTTNVVFSLICSYTLVTYIANINEPRSDCSFRIILLGESFEDYSPEFRILIHLGWLELSSWSLHVSLGIIHPGWVELPLARTKFHGPKPVRAIEILLYLQFI